MVKRHKAFKIIIAFLLILFFLQSVNADIFIDGASTKHHSPVYDGNSRSLETSVDFHVTSSNATVYFKLFAYEENDALKEGWLVHYLVYDNNSLIKDLGNKSGNDMTDYVSVEAYKTYTLKAFVHMPGNLSVNQSYQCMILICEHSGAGGGSGGIPDPNTLFTAYLTPTTTYLIYGYVYDKNKKPIPDIDVNITNMETGISVATKTNTAGFYSYNLYNLGYHNNDNIMVSATYSSITGYNITTVNIENNCSECNIIIPASVKETEKIENNYIPWIIFGCVVVAIAILFMIRRHRK